MSLLATLSQEKLDILKQAWTKCFEQISSDKALLQRFKTSIPSLSSSSDAEISDSILYELFDLAAFDDMDHTMLRFLRARKYNLDESLKMLYDALLWRKQIDIRKIMDHGESALAPRLVNAGMYFIWGQDLEGRPIIFLNVGNFLPTKSAQEIEEFKRYLVYQMETARFFIGSTGVMALADLSDFGRKNIDMEFSRIFAEMFQNYYPEILGKAVVVGSGLKMALFETVWGVTKFFLDVEVRKKISFQKAKGLDKLMRPEFIPKSLGGQFDEAKIRARAPGASPSPSQATDLAGRQVAEMKVFRDASFNTEPRNSSKARLRDLWLEMSKCRPQNLYEKLGLLKDGNVDWATATQT